MINMKNVLMVFIATSMLFAVSCSNGNAGNKSNEEKTETKSEIVKPDNKESDVLAIHLTKADFLTKVWDFETNSDVWNYKGDKPCIVDFYADWCGPCKIAAPILEELAKEYKGEIYIYKINTEQERELASAFGIRSIPAFLYCPKDGEPQMAAGIGHSPEETKKIFKDMIDSFLLGKKAAIDK